MQSRHDFRLTVSKNHCAPRAKKVDLKLNFLSSNRWWSLDISAAKLREPWAVPHL